MTEKIECVGVSLVVGCLGLFSGGGCCGFVVGAWSACGEE